MRYRSRTDIISQILDATNGGVSKTKIMYKAYLSYAQLKEYLSVMLENGLIEHERETNTFRTTEKGRAFIKAYNHMDSLTGPMTTPIQQ